MNYMELNANHEILRFDYSKNFYNNFINKVFPFISRSLTFPVDYDGYEILAHFGGADENSSKMPVIVTVRYEDKEKHKFDIFSGVVQSDLDIKDCLDEILHKENRIGDEKMKKSKLLQHIPYALAAQMKIAFDYDGRIV